METERKAVPCESSCAMSVAAVRQGDVKGYWQMPQGGIDRNEEPWAAAQRELYEETGVKDAELIAEVQHPLIEIFDR